jgi:hypothetical protein
MFWQRNGYWGWIDRGPQTRGRPVLELSLHSRVALARENNSRIVTDEIRKYIKE